MTHMLLRNGSSRFTSIRWSHVGFQSMCFAEDYDFYIWQFKLWNFELQNLEFSENSRILKTSKILKLVFLRFVFRIFLFFGKSISLLFLKKILYDNIRFLIGYQIELLIGSNWIFTLAHIFCIVYILLLRPFIRFFHEP